MSRYRSEMHGLDFLTRRAFIGALIALPAAASLPWVQQIKPRRTWDATDIVYNIKYKVATLTDDDRAKLHCALGVAS